MLPYQHITHGVDADVSEIDDHAEAVHLVDHSPSFEGYATVEGRGGNSGAVGEEGDEGGVGVDVVLEAEISTSQILSGATE